MTNAARVKYPAACCESSLIPRQLAAGYLIEYLSEKRKKEKAAQVKGLFDEFQNILNGGKARRLVEKLLVSDHEVWVSKYVADEFSDKLYEKWPDRAVRLVSILKRLSIHFCGSAEIQMANLRDAKDIPVLSDALYYQADVILTGDKNPCSPAQQGLPCLRNFGREVCRGYFLP